MSERAENVKPRVNKQFWKRSLKATTSVLSPSGSVKSLLLRRKGEIGIQGPVSRKSRFRVLQFPLYLKNAEDLGDKTLQTDFF